MKSRTVETIAGLILAGLLAGATPAPAAGNSAGAPEDQTARDQAPTLELLEFLGEWETDEGYWIDPTQFDPTPADDTEMEDETHNND